MLPPRDVRNIKLDDRTRIAVDRRAGPSAWGINRPAWSRFDARLLVGRRQSVVDFVGRDPLRYRGGDANLYAYVLGDPASLIDPWGLWSFFRWLYADDGNAPDDVYNAAMGAAGESYIANAATAHEALNALGTAPGVAGALGPGTSLVLRGLEGEQLHAAIMQQGNQPGPIPGLQPPGPPGPPNPGANNPCNKFNRAIRDLAPIVIPIAAAMEDAANGDEEGDVGPDDLADPPELPEVPPFGDRDPGQDLKLSPDDIQRLKDAGFDIHDLKRDVLGRNARLGGWDIFKDANGNLFVKPKGNLGPGEPLHINLNDFLQ